VCNRQALTARRRTTMTSLLLSKFNGLKTRAAGGKATPRDGEATLRNGDASERELDL
jgi:hypothetical protein